MQIANLEEGWYSHIDVTLCKELWPVPAAGRHMHDESEEHHGGDGQGSSSQDKNSGAGQGPRKLHLQGPSEWLLPVQGESLHQGMAYAGSSTGEGQGACSATNSTVSTVVTDANDRDTVSDVFTPTSHIWP